MPHPICTLHLVADVVHAVLGAVARARTSLAAQQPTGPTGRPSPQAAQAAARKTKRLEPQRTDVYQQRSLVVPHHLRPSARKRWGGITRGLPQWRTLRDLMERVYALCDRRCRTPTALDTLATLRRRLQRCTQVGDTLKKLFSPTREKARTFLDDKLWPSTSHAVERGTRRYRKRQTYVYRVRTPEQIRARLALALWRAAHAAGRQQTLASLQHARAG